jgi:hypothetical protein
MNESDRQRARQLLREDVAKAQVNAVAYIDWDAFEGVLDAVMASEAGKDQSAILQVFKASRHKALSAYFADRGVGPTN